MKRRTTTIALVLVAMLIAMGWVAGAARSQAGPQAPLGAEINYQGRLTDPDGRPLHGTYPMRFQIHDDPTANSVQWDSGVVNVDVDHGLFNVELGVDPTDFDGKGLWLRIYVDGEWLSPRQELLPVPYALSLRPGAQIERTTDGNALEALNVATGAALLASSTNGYGVHGYSENTHAVYGTQVGSTQGRGYGGYFTSNTGVGVYGYSSATSVLSNAYTPGVYGGSVNGVGVYGLSDGGAPGVLGESDGKGVYGLSNEGTGVYGRTKGTEADDYGVQGEADGSAYGVYGHQTSITGGLGVYGQNEGFGSAVSGYNVSNGNGVWGYSSGYHGIGGATGRGDNNYGLHTADNLYSANFHTTGAIMQVVLNGGDEPVEMGDLVAISGLATAPAGNGQPIIQVQKAQGTNSTAIMGVVASTYAEAWLVDASQVDPTGASGPVDPIPPATAGPVAPGEYLLVVVQGPCQVKVDAAGQAIRPGDLLSSAGKAGYATQAARVSLEGVSTAMPGTVLGKALQPLAGGQGLIYVWVTLQ